jgi:hypothetical protein
MALGLTTYWNDNRTKISEVFVILAEAPSEVMVRCLHDFQGKAQLHTGTWSMDCVDWTKSHGAIHIHYQGPNRLPIE